MGDDILKKLSKKMVANPNDYMDSLRRNIFMVTTEGKMTLHEIAESAGISFETLKSLVYGDSKDCKLSTVVALAKALNVSVDELVGCGTIDPIVVESMQISRNLPNTYLRFVRWAIRYHERMVSTKKVSEKAISIMHAECNNEGNILFTNNYELEDISGIQDIIRPKVFVGIKLPSDAYMPKYAEGEVLLIANDRKPMPKETAVIIYGGFMWLAKRMPVSDDKNAEYGFFSIRDGKFRVLEKDIEELIGYVAGTIIE